MTLIILAVLGALVAAAPVLAYYVRRRPRTECVPGWKRQGRAWGRD